MTNIAPNIAPTPPGGRHIPRATSASEESSSTFNEVLAQTTATQQQTDKNRPANQEESDHTATEKQLAESNSQEALSPQQLSEHNPKEQPNTPSKRLGQQANGATGELLNQKTVSLARAKNETSLGQQLQSILKNTGHDNHTTTTEQRGHLFQTTKNNKETVSLPKEFSKEASLGGALKDRAATTIPQNGAGQQQNLFAKNNTNTASSAPGFSSALRTESGTAPMGSLDQAANESQNPAPQITIIQQPSTTAIRTKNGPHQLFPESLRERIPARTSDFQAITAKDLVKGNVQQDVPGVQDSSLTRQHFNESGSAFSSSPGNGAFNDNPILQNSTQFTTSLTTSTMAESPAIQATTVPGSLMRSEALMQQVSHQMTLQIRNQETQLHIKLQPAELGELKIDLTYREGAIRANVFAQSRHVHEILEKNMPRLRELLEGQGLSVEEIQISNATDVLGDFDLFQEQLAGNNHPQENKTPFFTGKKTETREQFNQPTSPVQQGLNITA